MKAGDVVSFKGVKMTISEIKDDMVWCQWFVGSKLNEGWFSAGALDNA